MSLRSAMVDRARALAAVQTNYRVQGMTVVEATVGPWFRCRLTLPEANVDASRPRRRAVINPTLLYGTKDTAGEPVTLTVDTRVEVDSPELGRAVWAVVSEPSPLRRKRRVIGYEAHIERVEENESERQHQTRSPVGRSLRLLFQIAQGA
jgi:hypothetical protein